MRWRDEVRRNHKASDPAGPQPSELVSRTLRYGASVRGAQSLVLAGKAAALLQGRPQVAFADIARVARPVLRHRLIRSFEGEADGITTDAVIAELCASVPERPGDVERATA